MTKSSKQLAHAGKKNLRVLLPCLVLFLVILPIGPSSRAQSQQQSAALQPDIQSLAYFVGKWSCAGEFPASHKPISSHIVFAPDLDGSWLTLRWDDNLPNQFHALELWGFDKAARHIINSTYDNFGGMNTYQSAGWIADQLTWGPRDLPANSPIASEKYIFDRKSTKEFVYSWEIVRKPQSQWTVGDTLTCRRD